MCQTFLTNKKATNFPNGHSVFNEMGILLRVGKSGACRRQRENHQKFLLSNYLEALPPTVPMLGQARSPGGRLSARMPPPCLLLSHRSKLLQANRTALQLARPSSREHRCWPSRFENRGKNILASDSHRRKNCKSHVDPSCHPMMRSVTLLSSPP